MPSWIWFTLGAVSFQTVRFMLQKQLSQVALGAGGATFARFLYSAPVVLAGLLIWVGSTGRDWPALTAAFWPYVLAGGLAQIFATLSMVALFKTRHFAVGITFKKTETLLTVFVGLIVLGETISLAGFAAILLGMVGVLILSDSGGVEVRGLRRFWNRAAGLGLLSGLLLAMSGVFYRGATLQVQTEDSMLRAILTLAAVGMSQLIGMGGWMALYDRGELVRVTRAWKTAGWIGLTSMAGSICWFNAFTLQTAAYVNAVGQVEVVLSLLASVLFFHEKLSAREYWGIALISASVLGLILLL
ncbi:DMT family transporter [Pseudooceanicola nanhaiensis]|uniref:DMT family transporter n=1 Tax=Pseudooceanicola nanhaiensis TaxID=375761 RepID=UPI001CD1EF14|nr:DMT family transporter [Pseudooceanicola nanhaiensis]MCA0920119.1 DMT family transporter [Pseudooceanicola nanhaiensis]